VWGSIEYDSIETSEKMNYSLKTLKKLPAILGLTVTSALTAQQAVHPNVIYVFPDQFRNCALQSGTSTTQKCE
jgi:hypothetical protein